MLCAGDCTLGAVYRVLRAVCLFTAVLYLLCAICCLLCLPRCARCMALLELLGRLVGVAIRSKGYLHLSLSPTFWKVGS